MEKNTQNTALESGLPGEDETPLKRAAALSYDPSDEGAPVLAAFGEGFVAEKIVSIAKESGVPVLPDPNLASMLSRISVGDEISPEMYEAVAKILAFVGEVDRRYHERIRQSL
jgi:flagellar biosynthesis protein